jgi:hypothetical protein
MERRCIIMGKVRYRWHVYSRMKVRDGKIQLSVLLNLHVLMPKSRVCNENITVLG